MANQKEKRYAINYMFKIAGSVECKDLPHPKKHQHKKGEFCPAEYHRDAQLNLIDKLLNIEGMK